MKDEWPIAQLGDLVVEGRLSYGIVQPGQDQPGGVPIVRVTDLHDGRIDTARAMRVDPDVSARHSRTVLTGGELLVSIVGTIGETAIVPKELAGWNVNRAIAVVRPTSDVSAAWIRRSIQTKEAQGVLDAGLNTTVQSTLNLSELKRLPIPVPPPRVQQGIVDVLGALEEKVTANQRAIGLADEVGRALFQAAATGGYEVPLSSLARFVNGRAYTKNATGTGRVVVRIAELNSGIGLSTVWNDIEVPDDNIARAGDLLFAWSGSLTAARWYRPDAIVNQHIFKVIPNVGAPMWLVNQAVSATLDEFKGIAADKATTMGHIQRHHLDEPVRIPTPADVRRLDELMTALWEAALAAEVENLQLTSAQEELLPLLMSGNVRVKDIEKSVEGVL
jgi:type I restriction enzyme S subunit